MSSKSSQGPHTKSGFSVKMLVVAILIAIVFSTIIIIYPRMFSPSNIGPNTAPLQPSNSATTNK